MKAQATPSNVAAVQAGVFRLEAMRDVLQVKSRGAKDRVIPIKKLLADRLREWKQSTGGGYVARSLGMSKQLGESMSGVAIFQLVSKCGSKIGLPNLAPHDLRRT